MAGAGVEPASSATKPDLQLQISLRPDAHATYTIQPISLLFLLLFLLLHNARERTEVCNGVIKELLTVVVKRLAVDGKLRLAAFDFTVDHAEGKDVSKRP